LIEVNFPNNIRATISNGEWSCDDALWQDALTLTTEAIPDNDSAAIPYRDAYIANKCARALGGKVDESTLYKPLSTAEAGDEHDEF